MSVVQMLPSARSFAPIGRWAPAMAVGFVIAICSSALSQTGGEAVYVCSRYPNGVTRARYEAILTGNSKARGWGWRAMRRNPAVYVKGRIRHADHATITLHGWHRVLMNTEGQSKAMRNVAFLD